MCVCELGDWLDLFGENKLILHLVCLFFYLLVVGMKKSEMRWSKKGCGKGVTQTCHVTANDFGHSKSRLTFG